MKNAPKLIFELYGLKDSALYLLHDRIGVCFAYAGGKESLPRETGDKPPSFKDSRSSCDHVTFHDVVAAFYCRGKGIETVRRGAVKFRLYENEEIAAAFCAGTGDLGQHSCDWWQCRPDRDGRTK